MSKELKGESKGDKAYVGKCVPSIGNGQYQSLKEEMKGFSDLLKVMSDHVMGLEHNFLKLLIGTGCQPEMILPLRYLAMPEWIPLNT